MKKYLNTITVTLVNVTNSKYAFARPLAIIMVMLMLLIYSNTHAAAANDNCSAPIVISSLPYTSPTQNNAGANTDNIPGASGCGDHTRNLWYRVTGTGCTMTASTDFAASNFDTEIHVYTGSCGSFTEVACNDDAGSIWYLNAITSWPSVAGTTYFISVGYWTNSNVTGNFVLGVTSATSTPALSIAASATTICSGSSVTFTATPTNGGSSPSYQWRVNGVNAGTNSATFTSTTIANNAAVTCVMTSNLACASPTTATSNSISMTVNPSVTPSVSISTPSTSICANASATFTAVPTNGGSTPSYQWRVNGTNVGSNSNTYTANNFANGNIVTCVMTSNATCVSPATATSNSVTMTVTPQVTPTVSVSASANNVCTGTNVTFTASITNGGSSPSYQWKVNGTNVGTNASTYSSNTLTNGAQVNVVLTSNAACATSTTITSSQVGMTINPGPATSVSISTPSTTICSGASATFTATPTNGGTPTYQWKVNGVNAGTNSSTFTSSTLANGSAVTCVMTSSVACTAPATSNTLNITVNPNLTPSVSISTPSTTICSGTATTFTATPTNGGTPSYQWRLNGSNVGSNSATYTTSALANGNIVSCVMTSTETCRTANTATSNSINMTVNAVVAPTVTISTPATTICNGTAATLTAVPTNGGTPSYQWQLNGSNVGTNSATYTSSALTTGNVISCVMTSTSACASTPTATSNNISMTVNPIVTPSVSVNASATTICSGTAVNFTATPTNGGAAPVYQWLVNGSNAGTNNAVFTSSALANNDVVSVVMTSNAACISTATATSNNTTISLTPQVTATAGNDVNVCGNSAAITATGTGVWSFATGNGTIDNANNPNINLANLAAGTNQLVWTVTGGCNVATDTVNVTTMQFNNNIMHAQGVYFANRECLTEQGWTNYYLDVDGIMNTGDEKLLLSLNKNGNDIGTVGVDSFALKVELTSGYGNFGHLINAVDAPYVNNNVSSWVVMGRYWDVTPKVQPNTPVDVRFYFDSTDYADVIGMAAQMGWASITEEYADLSFYKVDGASGKDPNPANGHMGITSSEITIYDKTTAPTWSYSSFGNDHMAEYSVTTFSGGGGGFGGGGQGPLPVEMMYIQAEVVESTIQINWATALEINNDGFIVERSQDGATWTNIGWVNGNDNTTSISTYSYNDNTVQANVLYYYRLKQMDNDGAFEYTQIVTGAITNGISNNSVSFEAMYPNPAVNNTNVMVSCNYDAPVSISVYNIQGAILGSFNFSAVQGKNVFSLDLTDFSAGNYFVSVSNGDLVSQHKLSITK